MFFPLVEEIYTRVSKESGFETEVLELSDGGQIALDWRLAPNSNEKTPIVIFVSGLTGDNTKLYINTAVKQATRDGFDFVLVNHRGMGGLALTVSLLTSNDVLDSKDLSLG